MCVCILTSSCPSCTCRPINDLLRKRGRDGEGGRKGGREGEGRERVGGEGEGERKREGEGEGESESSFQ